MENNISKNTISKGFKNCLRIIELLKDTNKTIFTKNDILIVIQKFIGLSKLSQDRYFSALISHKLIKKLEDNNYGIGENSN